MKERMQTFFKESIVSKIVFLGASLGIISMVGYSTVAAQNGNGNGAVVTNTSYGCTKTHTVVNKNGTHTVVKDCGSPAEVTHTKN